MSQGIKVISTKLIIAVTISILTMMFCASTTYAETTKNVALTDQTHLSCSIITSEHLTTLQLYQRGIPLEDALNSLPRISREAKTRVEYIYNMAQSLGILNAYSDINSNYARCSTLVHQQKDIPAQDQLEYGYYFCSGENKVRYELILLFNKYHTLERVLQDTPDTHHHIAYQYNKLITHKGLLAAFDFTANNLKACLSNLQ